MSFDGPTKVCVENSMMVDMFVTGIDFVNRDLVCQDKSSRTCA